MQKNIVYVASVIVMVIANLVFNPGFAETATQEGVVPPAVVAPAPTEAAPTPAETSPTPMAAAPAQEVVAPPVAVTPAPAETTPTPTPVPESAAPVEAAPAADSAAPATPEASAAKPEASAQQEEKDPVDRKLVARVVWLKGGFIATSPGSQEKRALKTGSHIFMNDTLVTDEKGEAQIVFTDNSTVTFRPDTNFYINEYNYNPKGGKAGKKSAGKYVMDLIKGGFRTVTGLVAKNNPNDYEVNTPVATIGVRGTEFSVVIAKNGELFVKRYKGEPCVANKEKAKSTAMCLDEKKKYAQVATAGSDPVALASEPNVFNVDVEVVPVTFTSIDNGGGGSGSGFCIQ